MTTKAWDKAPNKNAISKNHQKNMISFKPKTPRIPENPLMELGSQIRLLKHVAKLIET